MKPWKLVHLFHPKEISAAFEALQSNAAALYTESSSSPLSFFVHRRRGGCSYRRDHIEMPLHLFYENSDVYRQLPAEVRRICAGLHEAAREYAEAVVQEPCVLPVSRAEVLRNLGKKSVLRVLRYPAGSGCRPHVDPGLCTALLTGSSGGLEVNTVDELPASFAHRPGDYTNLVKAEPAASMLPQTALSEEEAESPLDFLPHWEPVVTAHSGEAVVMAGNMTGVLSCGALPGVLHRVRRDWQEGAAALPHSSPSRHCTNAHDGFTRSATTRPQLQHACPPDSASVGTTAVATAAADQRDNVDNAASADRFNIIVELRPAQAKRWYAANRTACAAANTV
ncbi:hypothetical protein ABL78_2391 [Leptomonas seymouri]|uniref:Fe2OG dioxygenase domain-containing protein n=1 Tax=Leptomonas seymouri TaxID=5684 RepID=A0A0N1ILL8_LEPSE|nr:hypothetical protein ABL78_2391 [Leptomonas seymouri]|eukprot:KPI88495.1 hypothetical protein ABL78_2391 [Leptomonas seymouri]